MWLFVVLAAVVVALWAQWATALICPSCGAANSKKFLHQRRDGGPDGRYSHNPKVCRKCGHEGEPISRSEWKSLPGQSHNSALAKAARTTSGKKTGATNTSPKAEPRRWISPGQPLTVGRWQIPDGFLYVIEGDHDEQPYNPATIIRWQPIAGSASDAPAVGYWPSYYFLTPEQRCAFLQWLAGGRSDPTVDLGYVFLFFYGLEWRALVDGADRSEVAREIMRLYGIYGSNRSFHQHALNLLGAILLMGGRANSISPIYRACAEQGSRHGGLPSLLLDGVIRQHAGKNLPVKWAWEVATASGAFKKGVALERHPDEVRTAFDRNMAKRYPDGYPIPVVHDSVLIPYTWALRGAPVDGLRCPTTGLLIGPSGKKGDLATAPVWTGLAEIWHETLSEVKAKIRRPTLRPIEVPVSMKAAHHGHDATATALRQGGPAITESRNPDELTTMAVSAANSAGKTHISSEILPTISVPPARPAIQAWYAEHMDDNGLAKTTFGSLYATTLGGRSGELTRADQARLIEHVEANGLALEPDLRPNSPRVGSAEPCYVFSVKEAKSPSRRCQQLRLLVEAAVAIASSDGAVDEAEMEEIVDHLDEKGTLSVDDRRRLQFYASWLVTSRRIDQGFNRLRRTELPKTHRKAIGSLAITIALRDGTVTVAERKAIGVLYRAIDLPEDDLDALLQPPKDPKAGITIDWNAVARLQAETQEVQGLLAQVLSQDEDAGETAPVDAPSAPASPSSPASTAETPRATPPATQSPMDGLDARAANVLTALQGKTAISTADFKAICSTAGLFPNAAMDLINEWSDATLGDRYIDGDGPYEIASHLLPTKGIP